jgi:hypothetical protein
VQQQRRTDQKIQRKIKMVQPILCAFNAHLISKRGAGTAQCSAVRSRVSQFRTFKTILNGATVGTQASKTGRRTQRASKQQPAMA